LRLLLARFEESLKTVAMRIARTSAEVPVPKNANA
jgi:hypothetical protein